MGRNQAVRMTLGQSKCCVSGCDSEGAFFVSCRQCKGCIHGRCFDKVQEKLRPTNAEGYNIVICSKQCYEKYWNSIASPRRSLWHADGKGGPADPVTSESILVEWLAAGNNYVDFRAHENLTERQKACMAIEARINASGVKRRTVYELMKRIALIESQMQDALKWEIECTSSDITKWDECDRYNYREKLLRYCKYFDVLAPVFREKSSSFPSKDIVDNGSASTQTIAKDAEEVNSDDVSPEPDGQNDEAEIAEEVAKTPAATAGVRSPTAQRDALVPTKPSESAFDVSTKSGSSASSLPATQKSVKEGLMLTNRSSKSNNPVSKQKPPPVIARPSANHCLWNCQRNRKLHECPQCKRFYHEECFRERVLVEHQLCQPTDAEGNGIAVCTKKCLDEYQKSVRLPHNAPADNEHDDASEIMGAETQVPGASIQAPVPRQNAIVPQRQSESESNVSRPSKRRRTVQGGTTRRAGVRDQPAAAPDAVRSTDFMAQESEANNLRIELYRMKLAEMERKSRSEERKSNLWERSTSLDIELKETELARKGLAYRMELDLAYRNLRQQQNRPYAEIAVLYPDMIELFPPEEKNKFN